MTERKMLSLTIDLALTAAWLIVHFVIVIAAVYVGLILHNLTELLIDRVSSNSNKNVWR